MCVCVFLGERGEEGRGKKPEEWEGGGAFSMGIFHSMTGLVGCIKLTTSATKHACDEYNG